MCSFRFNQLLFTIFFIYPARYTSPDSGWYRLKGMEDGLQDGLLAPEVLRPPLRSGCTRCGFVVCILLMLTHFVYELGDKINRFEYWNGQIAGMGFSASEPLLIFIVVLLVVGVCSLLLSLVLSKGKWRERLLLLGVSSLVLFQVPTSILAETGGYEITSSISTMGGMLMFCLLELR